MLAQHIAQLKQDLDALAPHEAALSNLSRALTDAFNSGHKLLTCGNGGSSAEAAHLAEEFTGRFYRERRSLPGVCLSIDGTLLTCIGNDYGFDEIFARQVRSLGQAGDVFVGFTTSGNSENVLRALNVAKDKGLITALFSGKGGGKSKGIANYEFVVQSVNPSSARVQECHQLMLHVLCEQVECAILGVK